jgi:uncharacterized DUF497 family protein
MPFEYDPVKDEINRRKHGLPLPLGIQVFDGDFIEEEDARIDYGETRFSALGPVQALGGRICVCVYTWRGLKRRLISFRKANEEEIARYRASHA